MSNPFLGEMRPFGGNFAPRGWAFCSGQLVSTAQYSALYALIGTTYGGDGVTTFALPDLRGRVPIHQGQGPGLPARTLGSHAGSEAVTLAANQLPAHTHAFAASTSPATTNVPTNNFLAVPGNSGRMYINPSTAVLPVTVVMPANTVTSAGGSQPHENMMPTIALSYIIALEGIFPSQN